jgi:folate-dependent phosphoribosylglycinamide formyltransferase PurN
MKRKIVLLTGSELRHEFFRKFLSINKNITVLASFCESKEGNLLDHVQKDKQPNDLRTLHLLTREIVEKDFFELFCTYVNDKSNPIFIEKGDINNPRLVSKIIKLNPDIIISYGCSIIRSELLNEFKGRFVNMHLGLSPYYRGSGTNFWPFVNNELQFIGTTFMYIDEGVDTGEIIHQIRANISYNDNIHQIGNRLIRDSCIECVKLIRAFNKLERMEQIVLSSNEQRYYRKKDFTETSLIQAYKNISNGMIDQYLINKTQFENQYPIIKNPSILNL